MHIVHDKKLLQLIKIIPPITVIAFAVLSMLVVLNHNKALLASDILSLKKSFIASEKEMIKIQVNQVIQQITYEKNSTEKILKNNIKNYIYQAHSIATNIYNNNKDKSEKEVTTLITDALRDIRFNDGRGYFFIYKTDGLSVMHPVLPKMEGSSKIDFQDSRGNYIVRDLGQLAKENGEAFYHWWFVKPNNKNQEFEKIGFGKHFAPYDWFIGTGEYVADVENDIKKRLIERIANINYGLNGFIFLLDYQGNVISHFRKDFQGTNLNNNTDKNVVEVGNRIIETAKQGGGYLSYLSPEMPSTGKPAEKISFIHEFSEWGWVIGTGFYKEETEKYLANREQTIAQQNRSQLLNLLGLSSFVTLFFVALSLLLTKYLTHRFSHYENKINADFEELNRVRLQLQYQALHDTLTKLPNRILLDENILHGIKLSKESNKSLAVMFVDLDDFKKINDLHGHSVGDKLLEVLGKEFNKILKDHDSVARFGGDEFIFCFPLITNLQAAQQKIEIIQQIFNQEFIIQGKSIFSSSSIGVAMYPDDANNAEDLISKADIVLYKSKSVQKGRSLFFNEAINKQVQRDFLVEAELRMAISENELSVFYQPQICVETGVLKGVEALARWNNKKLGAVPPDEFIKLAEEIGIISDIGNFVITTALKDIHAFNGNNAHELQLSINISPKQLMAANFTEYTLNAINETGFNPNFVMLEITENVLISDLNKVTPLLNQLRGYGFKLSLDDFGTGYSSLSYLGNLPINEIKVDRSFIEKLLVNKQSESLVKTIIAIGQFYDLAIVAEGVETKEQYERLALYHCDLIQGYYFDRPLTLSELIAKYQCG